MALPVWYRVVAPRLDFPDLAPVPDVVSGIARRSRETELSTQAEVDRWVLAAETNSWSGRDKART